MQAGVYRYPDMDQVIFGRACADVVAEEATRLGATRIFVIASGTLNRTTDVVSRLVTGLGNRHATTWDRIAAHTPRTDCVEAANAARDAKADLIVTIGGGSVTDAGKLVQLCLANDVTAAAQLDDYRRITNATPPTRKPLKAPVVRQVAVPTTLSAGEFNPGAGCTDTATKKKESYFHALHVPRTVVLDPAVTVHTPLWLFLSSGIRAVDHAAEDICSPRCNAYAEAADIHALKLLSRGLRAVKANEGDLAARLDCLQGMWLSVVGSQAGVDKGASHAIGHILGGTAGVPHGYTSCVMLPFVMKWNKPVNAERQAIISAALGRPGADAGDALHELIAGLGLPRSLQAVGVGADQFDLLAENTMHDRWTYTNPRKIDGPADVKAILQMAA
ncbi:iron-containing alcohol dehydrogenase [Reyranella sp. CPCC 100927]|uniref:iron-containing alcohol dehydrogenase n=1 Tax=Reyranella sp. CPCC 100927 TaxID=2599616 RepID=UPI0011B37AE8|nr:iron-containing alcohol dehydrogenase [Reyranella sp. CPCC 100927]TWT04993.1 iron-containing alcohol dehydrogenase [Reyranella sp. CPCC 100927]